MTGPENIFEKGTEGLQEGRDYVVVDGLRIDAKEFDPEYKCILDKVEVEVEKEVVSVDLFWFDIWWGKKKLLKERHGIVWRSLAELNPHISFD